MILMKDGNRHSLNAFARIIDGDENFRFEEVAATPGRQRYAWTFLSTFQFATDCAVWTIQ